MFNNIDALPLGKLLQPVQGSSSKTKKLRKRGVPPVAPPTK